MIHTASSASGGASPLLALLVILAVAFTCGQVARLVRQPRVLGEMVAGVALGPSLFGAIAPDLQRGIFDEGVKSVLSGLSAIGIALYMFLVGVRFDHRKSSGLPCMLPLGSIAAGGIIPISVGALLASTVLSDVRPEGVGAPQYMLFVGGAFSITAFPMLASILEERRMDQTRFGTLATITAAGDDAVAWCILALAIGLGARSGLSAVLAIGLTLAFIATCAILVPRLVRPMVQRAVQRGQLTDGSKAALVLLALLGGWVTDIIGVYAVFGAFVAGAFVPYDSRFADYIQRGLMQSVSILFLPAFFTWSGLNTDLGAVVTAKRLGLLAAVVGVGLFVKLLPVYGVARAFGRPHGEALALGGLMTARGLMILIFIQVGAQQGVIEPELFSAFVVLAIVSTASALPIYRLFFTDATEERERGMSDSGTASSFTPLPWLSPPPVARPSTSASKQS